MAELLKSGAVMSRQALLAFGLQAVAYIRAQEVNGIPCFAVHAADGTPLGQFDALAAAMAACWQNDLEPVSVH
jgi:hypothetical protein